MVTLIAPINHSPLADEEALQKAFQGSIIAMLISQFFSFLLIFFSEQNCFDGLSL
jgi:hypothetical protein